MDALNIAYQSAADRMPGVTLEQFRAALAGAEVHPVTVDGNTAGAVIVQGAEVHACVLPWACGRWMSRAMLRVLDDVIARHGRAETSATTEAGRKFVQRLGFVPSGDKWVKYGH